MKNHEIPVILNENGCTKKPVVDCDQQRNLVIPFETKDQDYCLGILTRVNECRDRQGSHTNQGFQQMETKLNHIQEIVSGKGNTRNGSVCLKLSHQLPHYMFWKIDPSSQSKDTFQISWAHKFVYAFPPFALIGRSLQSKSGLVSNAHNNPSMSRSTIVSRVFKNVCKKATTSSSTQKYTERSSRILNPLVMRNSL